MASSNNTLTVYWKNGCVTEASFLDPAARESAAVATELDFMFDEVGKGLYVNASALVVDGESDVKDKGKGPEATWRPLYSMRLFGPKELAEVDCIYLGSQQVMASLDGTIYSLMKLNRLAEVYLNEASAMSSYRLINDVASSLAQDHGLLFDEEGTASLSELMGLSPEILNRAMAVCANEGEMGAFEGAEAANGPSADADAASSEGAIVPSPAPMESHIDFEDDEGDDTWI